MMTKAEKLFESISNIEDFFLVEAEVFNIGQVKASKRKRIAKYSAAGLAVSAGVAMAYLFFKPKGRIKTA